MLGRVRARTEKWKERHRLLGYASPLPLLLQSHSSHQCICTQLLTLTDMPHSGACTNLCMLGTHTVQRHSLACVFACIDVHTCIDTLRTFFTALHVCRGGWVGEISRSRPDGPSQTDPPCWISISLAPHTQLCSKPNTGSLHKIPSS